MNRTLVVGLTVLVLAQSSNASAQAPTSGAPYAPPKTPWGDPDLQATWSGDSAFGIPLQRPQQLGNKAELTDREFADKVVRDEQAGQP